MQVIRGNTDIKPVPIYSQKSYWDEYWFLDLWLKEATSKRHTDKIHYHLTAVNQKLLNITQYLQDKGRTPEMARDNNDNYGGYSFVNWRPNTEEKKFIKEKLGSGFDFDLALEEVVSEGYKLSVSYVVNSDSFVASLTCKDRNDDNYKKTLTLWHKSAIVACAGVLIAHLDLLGTDWSGPGIGKSEHDW